MKVNINKHFSKEREKEIKIAIKNCNRAINKYDNFFKAGSYPLMIGGVMAKYQDDWLKATWEKKDLEIELYQLQGKELTPELADWKEKFWVHNERQNEV